MGPGLLSAALLFVGTFVLYSEHYLVSERSRHSPSQERAGGPGWPEATRGKLRRQEGHQDQEKEGWAAKGSIGSFLCLDSLPCLFPAAAVFNSESLHFHCSSCL